MMTTEQKIERRRSIMSLTADLRADYGATQDELRKVELEMDGINYPCARLVRLSDKRWDLSARLRMINETIERRVETFLSELAA